MTDQAFTVAEAVQILDPPIPRRTLERLAATLTPVDYRCHGGRPAARYNLPDLLRVHAEWARRSPRSLAMT